MLSTCDRCKRRKDRKMDKKLTVRLYSRKVKLFPEEIIVPENFVYPKLGKVSRHIEKYAMNQSLDPIIVDENNVLIDGYCSLIVAKIVRMDEVEVYRIKASMRIAD